MTLNRLFILPVLLIANLANAQNAGVAKGPRLNLPPAAAMFDKDVVTPRLNAVAMPFSSQIARFPYERNYIYPAYVQVGANINFEFSDDDPVVGLYTDPDPRWNCELTKDRVDVLCTTNEANVSINILIKTKRKRKYEISLLSVPEGKPWYKRVSWQIPGAKNFEEYDESLTNSEVVQQPATKGSSSAATQSSLSATRKINRPANVCDLGSVNDLNFAYEISGSARFRPVQVYDNGQGCTWIQLANSFDAPALFIFDRHGKTELVEWTMDEKNNLVLRRPAEYGILLVLNDEEIKILPKKKGTRSNTAWRGDSHGD